MQTWKTDMHTAGEGRGGWDELGDWDWHLYTTMRKTDSQLEPVVQHRELSSVLCDDLEGQKGEAGRGRRLKWKGIYVYLYLIYVGVWQKPTQHHKAIILQFKIKSKKILKRYQQITLWKSIIIHHYYYNYYHQYIGLQKFYEFYILICLCFHKISVYCKIDV